MAAVSQISRDMKDMKISVSQNVDMDAVFADGVG